MRQTPLTEDYFYHIYNRGVDKRKVFLQKSDYYRFLHDLFEFNDADASENFFRRFSTVGSPTSHKERKPLVDIICFCLMPNHFHLLVRQRGKDGISKFMQKLGTGYTNYFNLKYDRSGVLFQGKFKSVHVANDNYLTHLTRYIHLNPTEIVESVWKEKGIDNRQRVNTFLRSYRWSSYLDYIGIKNYPSIIEKEFLLRYFQKGGEYEEFVKNFIVNDLEKIGDLLIEE